LNQILAGAKERGENRPDPRQIAPVRSAVNFVFECDGTNVMSESGVAALDHTIQETNIWLKAIAEELPFDNRHHAYNALRAVLHALRDRLPPEAAVHLGAQLPMLVRGIYYEGWRMAGKPTKERSAQEFSDHVRKELPLTCGRIDGMSTHRPVGAIMGSTNRPSMRTSGRGDGSA
jgi:hypothetical protein